MIDSSTRQLARCHPLHQRGGRCAARRTPESSMNGSRSQSARWMWPQARPAAAGCPPRPGCGAGPRRFLSVPRPPDGNLDFGSAHRRQQAAPAALAVLDALVRAQPKWGAAHYERALALSVAGQGDAALEALRQAVALEPHLTDAWRALQITCAPAAMRRQLRQPTPSKSRPPLAIQDCCRRHKRSSRNRIPVAEHCFATPV